MVPSDNQIREELLDKIVSDVQADDPPDGALRGALANVGDRLRNPPEEMPQALYVGADTYPQPRTRISPLTRGILGVGIPAAVAAAVLLAVGLWPETGRQDSPGGAGRVYALSDIPQLFRSAKVLHLHGWASGDQKVKLVRDYWLDTANGRWHISHGVAGLVDGSDPPEELKKLKNRGRRWIFDGEYRMMLSDEAPGAPGDTSIKTTAEFARLTPFQRNLGLRRYYEWATESLKSFEDARALGLFAKVGQEKLDGTDFDIWQSEQDRGRYDKAADTVVYDGRNWIRIKVWMSPTLGVLGRVEKWTKGPETNETWVLGEVAEKIERDVTPPPGIFDTVPPPDCTLKNTGEAAPVLSISDNCDSDKIGNLRIRYHIGFNFSDGTVLLAWSSRDPASMESQAPLFQDLYPGGPLPKLPIEIQTLVPENRDCELTYVGRHLAWTQKENDFFEWSLFVPDKDLTLPQSRCARGLELRYTLNTVLPTAVDRPTLRSGGDWITPETRIEDPAAFQELVLEAMAELSDGGVTPEGMTYDYLMQLVRQIRGSLGTP